MIYHLIKKFYALPIGEKLAFWEALILLPLFSGVLRISSFQRLTKVLGLSRSLRGNPTPLIPPARIASLVAAAGQCCFPHPSCLTRSMVLMWLLRRRSIQARLHIGVNKESGIFKAHAWVSHGDQVLNDKADVGEHFAAFDAFDDHALTGT